MVNHVGLIRRWFLTGMCLLAILAQITNPVSVLADHTPDPVNVTIAGSLQSELGCPGDWDPACTATHLVFDASDGVWQGIWSIPAGGYEYKAVLNNNWDENYGANAQFNGPNIPLNLGAATDVKFYYDHETHWVTDSNNRVIATVAGNFQSEMGCPGDWQPDCLRSWLKDPDGDGTFLFQTTALPAGNYEGKVAVNESWDENYGQGGVPGGANIPFSVTNDGDQVRFIYDPVIHILTIDVMPAGPDYSVALVGSLQSELGCAGDWDPACIATELVYDVEDDVWQQTFSIPAGDWEYKAALNDSWDENYGANAQPGGANIHLNLGIATNVKFYYDPETHWVTDNRNAVIAVAPGNFQSELGCNGDWDPGCLRSWLQDIDGDGIYTFETTALPAGSYEGKVTINESWDENYGQGGVPGGANIPFFVPFDGAKVTFEYNASTHVLVIQAGFGQDNDIAWDGLRHDSRDLLYRTPGGAVPAGTDVLIRFRTFHNDVTGVSLRVYDINENGQHIIPMTLAAADVSCYQPGLETSTCDFWQASLNEAFPNNLWYRFVITDGMDVDYYADNTPALDGGLGSVTDDVVDNSFALMFFDPAFTAPEWAKSASIYQIFPDRFRDGRSSNNAKTGDVRYDDPVIKLSWGTLPEGYCRYYSDAATNCPWRYDATPPDWSPDKEGPRGRDYFGGDLKGVDQYLDYLQSLGVNTIYFNPIFDAGSNHSYDTQDYYKIDPYFGTQKDWENLVKHADERGMKIILDGVFNHMSSDSPIFDRYQHYATLGACESVSSPYRSWFTFHEVIPGSGTCVGSGGPNSATYDGWFGFDSIPVINKSLPEVQQYFLTNSDSVAKYWLNEGAGGWRMDVSGDPSFPDGYWETFRDVTKGTDPDALLVSETWQKDSTLLRMLRGDRLDTTMNYRLRDAVIGLLTPGPFDSKGFADSGRVLKPSEFAARLESVREDYPDATYYSLMNLLDSHDTERLRWALTPGSETTASKEQDAANVAEGKIKQQIASLIQFTVPGAPTVFYGDEVGMTGDDDPDDRRTYPWVDKGGTPDQTMFKHYQTLNSLRKESGVLVNGEFKMLLADDTNQIVAYGRKTTDQAALVVVNLSDQIQPVSVPVAGYLPDGIVLTPLYGVEKPGAIPVPFPTSIQAVNGFVSFDLAPLSARLIATDQTDLQPTATPENLHVTNEGDGTVSLAWNNVPGSAGYNIYRSPVSGGGWVKLNSTPLTSAVYTDTGLQNARTYFYVVASLDPVGNESEYSNQVSAMPRLTIGWANLQWPPTINHTISVLNRTDTVYGQVWIDGYTNQPGSTPNLRAQLGHGPANSDPSGNPNWVWYDASFNVDAGNNDEFKASMLPDTVGTYDYAYRYSTTGGYDWIYADLDGIGNGYSSSQAGKMTVNPSGDNTPPAVPTGLTVVSASPAGVELIWDAVAGDPTLYGYEILRSDASSGPFTLIAFVTGTTYTDQAVIESKTYYYVVRSLDLSFNRSGNSNEVMATAELRTVTVVFNVTVPSTTDATGRAVYIAGTLNRLDGGLPEWDAGGLVITQVDSTHWTVTLTGKETTQIEYKYTLGLWDYVEKGASCDEVSNRQLTLSYGGTGTQIVNDTVSNWRNVAPCGN